MAQPPPPLDEILLQVSDAVFADVVQVRTLPVPSPPSRSVAAQEVELYVHERLRGHAATVGARLLAIKPVAPYSLRQGLRALFLLAPDGAGGLQIAGLYGPDTYDEATVRLALA